MKLKHLALAALAVIAGQAMAQQVTGSPSTSTLELVVADGSSSYSYNTGISLAQLVAGTVTQSIVLPNWSYSTEFTQGAFDPVSNQAGVQWGLLGGTLGNGTVDSIMVTGQSVPSTSFNNTSLKLDATTISADLPAIINNSPQASGTAGYADPNQIFQLGGYKGTGENQGLATGVNTTNLYYETLVPTGTLVRGATLANIASVSKESVSFNATTGTLTFTAAAAVPEPNGFLLMLAGISVVGFVAARRRA